MFLSMQLFVVHFQKASLLFVLAFSAQKCKTFMRGEEMHFEENVELSIAWRLSMMECDNVENVNFAEKVQKM